MKRDELNKKIETVNSKKSTKKKSKPKSVKKKQHKDNTEIDTEKVKPWVEMGITEQEYQHLLDNGYIEN